MNMSLESSFVEIFADALAAFRRLAAAYRSRRQVMQLEEWSDAQLADIGLHRSDINRALALPMSDDPTARLAEWRRESTEARRAQYREAGAILVRIKEQRASRLHALVVGRRAGA
jgi:uncharacterized protein YjiS (DUF1127 family)